MDALTQKSRPAVCMVCRIYLKSHDPCQPRLQFARLSCISSDNFLAFHLAFFERSILHVSACGILSGTVFGPGANRGL